MMLYLNKLYCVIVLLLLSNNAYARSKNNYDDDVEWKGLYISAAIGFGGPQFFQSYSPKIIIDPYMYQYALKFNVLLKSYII